MQDQQKLDQKLDIISEKLDELESDAPDSLFAVQIKCLADKLDKEHTELPRSAQQKGMPQEEGQKAFHKGFKVNMKSLCQA